MLTEIRDRSSGWFAYIIAALIIIPMAFWGIQEYASTDAQPVIIEIGDQKITQQAFQAQLGNAQAQAQARNPNLANSDIFSSDFYKRQVLDGMIDRALAREIANEQKYRVGDKELAGFIKESPLFQNDGKFDKQAYETYATGNFASKTRFETETRENSRIFQVSSGYDESALVLPEEVRSLLEIQAEQRTFDLITINQADFIEGVEVTDADVSEYYQSNLDRFMEPDRMSVSYVELDIEQIAATVEIEEGALRAIYDDNIDSYKSPETRDTRHILLSVGGDKSASEQRTKAQELIEQLKQGADFAEIAKEYSQDPGSAANGGSLGTVEAGAMVAEFEEATFALAEGEISDPILTQFGYHIIKVDKINGIEPQAFEEVKFDIEQEERDRLAQDILLDRFDQLRDLVFNQSDSLDNTVSELGLSLKSTELFSRASGLGIAANEAVRAAAFSDLVATEGRNSEPIELADGVYVALRKLAFEASAPKALADVSAEIKATLTSQRASAAAEQAGDSILVKANSSWDELSSDESVKIDTYTVTMIDTDRKVPGDVLREVVKMQLAAGDAAKVMSFTGAAGNFNIVRLTKIAPGNVAAVSEQIKDSTRRLIAQRNGQSLFQSYLKGLSEELKDKVNQDLL